jgi:hypothetical protein
LFRVRELGRCQRIIIFFSQSHAKTSLLEGYHRLPEAPYLPLPLHEDRLEDLWRLGFEPGRLAPIELPEEALPRELLRDLVDLGPGDAGCILYLVDRAGAVGVIVDDNEALTYLLKVGLETAGLFKVDTYNDSLDAVLDFPHTYAVVILDVQMPKMNGFQVYEEPKRSAPT